jgi:hypothetical protein
VVGGWLLPASRDPAALAPLAAARDVSPARRAGPAVGPPTSAYDLAAARVCNLRRQV